MTIQDYISFAEDPVNWGKFILKEVETNIVEPDENGVEVRQKAIQKIEITSGGLMYSFYDKEATEKDKIDLAAKLEKLERFLKDAEVVEIIPLPIKEEILEAVPAPLEEEVIS